ncbi:hypothetical protein BH24DEI2_BH24DEI2_03990 [soil metagenome]
MPYLQLKKAWLWLWLVPALVLATSSLAEARWRTAYELAGQFALALAVSALVIPVRLLRFTLVVVLAVFFVVALAGPILASHVWQDPQALGFDDLLTNLRHNTVTTVAARSWNVPADAERLELSFEARLAEGTLGWDWFRSAGDFEVTPLEEDGAAFTHVVTPQGGDPYLFRTFELAGPAGGKTFRIQLEMRSATPIPAKACRGIWLQTWGPGGGAACQAVALGREWRPVYLEWTAPAESESSVVRVVLNDFDGLSYDLRKVELYERSEGAWRRLEPLLQAAVSLALVWDGKNVEPQAGWGLLPTSAWQTFDFLLAPPAGASLRALLSVGSSQSKDVAVEVRNTRLSDRRGHLVAPVPTFPRAQLWFSHPNLAAHTLLAFSLATLTTLSSPALTLVVSGGAALSVFLIRSRAAGLALVLGAGWFSLLAYPFKARSRVVLFLAAAVLLVSALTFTSSTFRSRVFFERTGTNRPEIWRVAWQAFLEHPLTGLGPTSFSTYWQATYVGNSQEIVPHAHNLWLQFAALYGLPGLIAILWLTGGFLYLAWTWGRWRGLALVVPIFIMNLFDYTLFYSGVLFPLILGMNALRQKEPPVQAEP